MYVDLYRYFALDAHDMHTWAAMFLEILVFAK